MSRKESHSVSIINWMLTILVCSIPVVNIIAYILFIIFARVRSKRKFAIAGLILQILLIVLAIVAIVFFPEWISKLAEWVRSLLPAAEGQ